jgi:formate-dependent phosphoribosylglycinamide formyltransferase (GAR transformylase)
MLFEQIDAARNFKSTPQARSGGARQGFGKPESFPRRRMGVALATADDIATARERALEAAAKVKPVSGK